MPQFDPLVVPLMEGCYQPASVALSLKELERENTRVKTIVADQALDIDMLKELNRGPYGVVLRFHAGRAVAPPESGANLELARAMADYIEHS